MSVNVALGDGGRVWLRVDYITYAPLQRLIDTALANNRNLHLALSRVEEARAT